MSERGSSRRRERAGRGTPADTRSHPGVLGPDPYAWCVPIVKRVVKWTIGVVVIAALVVAGGALSGLVAPVPAATLTTVSEQPQTDDASFSLPKAGASGIGFADKTDLIAGRKATTSMPIGSIAKIVTALMVLEEHPISDASSSPTLTMTQADVQSYNSYEAKGGSVTEVLQGLQLSEYQVLQLMLLPSANNYAASAASWAFGSIDGFLNATTTWLASKGLRGTTITDPAGLDTGTVSTVSDLIALGRLALANPIIAGIASQSRASIPVIGTVTNTNTLLGSNGIIGIKTGTTLQAGYCLLFAVDAGSGAAGSPVVGVVLGQLSRDRLHAAVTKLATQIHAAYHTVVVAKKDAVAATLTTEWGSSTELTFSDDLSVSTVGKTTVTVAATHPDVTSLVSGSTDGVATVTVTDLRGSTSYPIQLTSTGELDSAPISWQLDHALRWIPDDVLPFLGWR